MITGARRLPPHHVTIRVPWHDGGWTGSVCTRPLDNTSCLILPRIGEGRRDDVEARCAGQRLDELDRAELPPCVGERVSFMARFAFTRTMTHPYKEFYPGTHGHFEPTRFMQPEYSAACVPFRWMLRENVEGNAKDGEIGIAEGLKIGWVPDREPDIRNYQGKEVHTAWIQQAGVAPRHRRVLDSRRRYGRACGFGFRSDARPPLGSWPTSPPRARSTRGASGACVRSSMRSRCSIRWSVDVGPQEMV